MNIRYFTLVTTFILTGQCVTAQADTLAGWVSHVADGDTITVLDYSNQQHKVRLMGIDAPEKRQAFGSRSEQNLSMLVNGHDVEVEWHKFDRYGRIIGKVMVASIDSPCNHQRDCPKTLDAGLEQIKAGEAWWYQKYAKQQMPEDQASYAQAEFDTKIRRNGLWEDTHPVAPWNFRRGKK